jgi:hypothetical protein
MTFDELDPMARQYVATALWSTTDGTTPDGGDPLDRRYTGTDIEYQSLARMVADCDAFRDLVAAELPFVLAECDEADLGHDLWLTRAGHGAGFWDGAYAWLDREGLNVGEMLTRLCKRLPARSLYVGDEACIHEASA